MSKPVVPVLIIAFLSLSSCFIPVAKAEDTEVFDPTSLCPETATAIEGMLENGAEWLICLPPLGFWNGSLLLFSHGTVSALQPDKSGQLEALVGQLNVDDVSIPELVNALDFAFMVGARSKVGLSVLEGVAEVKELIQVFEDEVAPPAHVFPVGVSQGGLIATLVNEESEHFRLDGALAVCGPIGSFRFQARYFMDFMVVAEFFLRDRIMEILADLNLEADTLLREDENGDPQVPEDVLDNWSSVKSAILEETDSETLNKIFDCANVPSDPGGTHLPTEIAEDLFDDSFRANNDAIEVLQGNPISNQRRIYFCPKTFEDTFRLNQGAKRFAFTANPERVDLHETSGEPFSPLVTLHNFPDHRVPFRHEVQYQLKTQETGSTELFTPLPVFRFGHCNVEASEAVAALTLLVFQATGWEMFQPERVLPDAESRRRFREFMEQSNILP